MPRLREKTEATIIGISAISPKRSVPVCCAIKAGLRVFTNAFRYQLEGTPIQAVDVELPLADTPMTAAGGAVKSRPK